MGFPYSFPFPMPGPATADLDNLGYELAGLSPGSALYWVALATMTAEELATFGSESPPLEEDSFEIEWNNDDYLFAFDVPDTDPTLLDTDVSEGEAIEDFEEGWDNNQSYLFELGSLGDGIFDDVVPLTSEDKEDFEEGWDDNQNYDFTLGTSTAAIYDSALTPELFENFEDGWSGTGAGNDYELTLPASTAVVFDGAGADTIEDFEETFQEVQVTVVAGSDLFTAGAAHGLSAGDRVSFRLGSSGALPAGVNPLFEYFVIASGLTGTQFRVSVVSGGGTIDVVDEGAGDFFVRGDPRRFWILDA